MTSLFLLMLIDERGKGNIFNLATYAGASDDQIERFYVGNIPQSAEMARNLQSLGDW